MLVAATSFFARTGISQHYNIGGSRTSTPFGNASSSLSSTANLEFTIPVVIGLWKVQSAYHKVTNKRVSVWSFDKKGPDMERIGPLSKERALEVLKAESSALGRLRHPSILEMVEPLEETRNELIFATEPILSSLELSIPGGKRKSPLVELDEVEIQKGILQICKGLSFLHSSAKIIHTNVCPESIVINTAGDWKISGLGLAISLLQSDGTATRWEFPTFDGRVPSYIQRSFDYMAPEYALDEALITASDMYSLGCLIYAVHCKGNPPFQTHGSLGALRENAGRPPPNMERLDPDLQSLLRSLITRHGINRPTPTTLPSHPFFSSLPISTLNFLDRSNFTSKTREEKISFMKGLTTVLDKFTEGLRIRKILPSLLEEMKDALLLPYILPNIFAIATMLPPDQFAKLVLPSLRPLFAVKEPPQNMLTLLDNLGMLQSKTEKRVFREDVLPLVYHALESDHAVVQERALETIPDLCETIDYAEVQGVLFPRVALLFTTTRLLSVKVATLTTFHTLVKTLDQTTLTQKLVPLLSKIRTKEPAVTMATLSVQEAMGFKIDREAVATLVLPQLWAMSIGPLLNVEQFHRFMEVIRKLGERVEKEHDQFLRDSQRLEDRSAAKTNGNAASKSFVGSVDFESLIGASGAAGKKPIQVEDSSGWDDDVWGSIFTNGDGVSDQVSTPLPVTSPPNTQATSVPILPSPQDSVRSLNQRSMPPKAPVTTYSTAISSTSTRMQASVTGTNPSIMSMKSTILGGVQHTVVPPTSLSQPSKPNYNIILPPIAPNITAPLSQISQHNRSLSRPSTSQIVSTPAAPWTTTPPSMGTLLTPSKPAQPAWPTGSTPKPLTKDDWAAFDPLS